MPDDWDLENDPPPYKPIHPFLFPFWYLWCEVQAVAWTIGLVLIWLTCLGMGSIEAEFGFGYIRPDGQEVRKCYKLNLPGWLD